MKNLNWSNRTKFLNKFLKPILSLNLIQLTIPDKPQSSKQKYITTEEGENLLDTTKQSKETN